MNWYSLIDNLSMNIASLATRKYAYFSQDVAGSRISDLLKLITFSIPIIENAGHYTTMIGYNGTRNEAGFHVAQWKGFDYPTIIYHHGAAEGSYDLSFNKILANERNLIDANLICIQAMFNHNNLEFMQSIRSLANYCLLLASSTKLIEAIICQIRTKSCANIVVAGTSLGGFVTNLHCTYYQSADSYVPLLAGARLGDVFLDSAYSKVTAKSALSHKHKILGCLNFEIDFKEQNRSKVFPLLSKYDQIITYDVHRQDFKPDTVRTILYGHATGATKFKMLREHILSHL